MSSAGAVNQPLRGRRDLELHGIGFAVVFGNAAGFAAEKIYNRVVAEMKFPGLLQIHHAGERHDPFDRGLVTGQAQRQLSAGGVAHHNQLREIQIVALGDLRNVAVGAAQVFEGARPSSSRVPYAAILDIPGGQSFGRKGGAEMSGMLQIVFGAPVAAVDIHHDRERAVGFRAGADRRTDWGRSRRSGVRRRVAAGA